MALTKAYIGKAGVGSASFLNLPSYNQSAGNTIVVFTESYSGTVTSITDTAGNTYNPVFGGSGYTVSSSHLQCWFAPNCLGNAANVIKVNYSASLSYSTAAAYDLGGATNIFPDVYTSNTGNSTAAASANYTTSAANEALFSFAATTSGSFSASAVDSSFTLDDGTIVATSTNMAGVASKLVTSIQTAQHVTFTNTSTVWVEIFVSFAAATGLTSAYLGKAGASASSSISLPVHNQPAGNTVVVFTETYSSTISSVSDTAGNTYLPIFAGAGISIGSSVVLQAWYVANCLGNVANVVTVNYSGSTSYSTAAGFDLGNDTNIVPDVSSSNTGSSAAGASSNYTTSSANEVLLAFLSVVTGSLVASAVDSSYNLNDGNIQATGSNLTAVASNVVSSIQTAQHVTFTNTNTAWGLIFVSFAHSVPPPVVSNSVVCIMQ